MIAWKRWASYPTVRLWEAVALLLDIDPESLRGSSDNYLPGIGGGPWFERFSFPNHKKYADFSEAMRIAKRAVIREGPIYLRKGGSDGNAEVSLAEVAAYFVSCEWPDIPTRLMQLVGSIPSTTAAPKPGQPLDANPTPVSNAVVPRTDSSRHRLGALNAAEAVAAVDTADRRETGETAPLAPLIHLTKLPRRDDLWPAIEVAQAKCRNPKDTAEVWGELCRMADEEVSPMLANTPQGIKWKRHGEDAYLKRGALDKRLNPDKRKRR